MTERSAASRRSLVFVVGSGRSGTSVFSGIMQRLGVYVPQPEVKPDESNPKGFAESKWVVDFHTRLLKTARVQTADARPSAWTKTAAVADDAVAAELRAFLKAQYAVADHVLIKDPRLAWFLPLWRRCAADLGVTPRFVTMLRHPAAVVDSKSRYYGAWQGDVSRAAGWVNTMLYTERATREGLRAFVRYEELLADWPKVIGRVGDALELVTTGEATSGQIRAADEFVDPGLRRSSSGWEDLRMPAALQQQADHVWELLCRLADKDGGSVDDELVAELDAARDAYVSLYQDAEAIAQSSITSAIRAGQGKKSRSAEAAATKWIPERYRRKVPIRWRKAILAMIGQRGRR